jgi:hypothetical protein
MTMMMRSTAIAAALSLPLAAPAVAQQAQEGGPAEDGGQQDAGQPDVLVAKVGDAEIRSSDVLTAIGALPGQLRDQPPEVVVPIALDQLVLRELILAEAEAENLWEDERVAALAADGTQPSRDDAMVQVWLQREMEDRVTDDYVQQTYDDLQQPSTEEAVPSLEEVRPQIEQRLEQEALADVRADLREGADIVFYSPSGEPIEPEDGESSGGAADQ